jgi:uncharacterized coiled-coil DUF342 family protein
MEGLEIIKQLVDSLTVSLTNILIKIESINPVLSRLSEEMKDGKNISQDTINTVNELKTEILSYHEYMIQLPVTINNINEIKETVESIEKSIEDIKTKTGTIPDISNQFKINNKLLTPLSNFTEWITSPIGKLIAVITAIIAIAGGVQTIMWLFELISSK